MNKLFLHSVTNTTTGHKHKSRFRTNRVFIATIKALALFCYFCLMSSCGLTRTTNTHNKIINLHEIKRKTIRTAAHPMTNTSTYIIKNSFMKIKVKPQNFYEYRKQGVASVYGTGDNTHGKLTASGLLFNANLMMAAMRDVPIPSIAKVTNLKNGKSVEVLVADRGPFAKVQSRIIDLSTAAAQKIGIGRAGLAPVLVEINVKKSLSLASRLPSYRKRVKMAAQEQKQLLSQMTQTSKILKHRQLVISPFKKQTNHKRNCPIFSMLDNSPENLSPANTQKQESMMQRVIKIWRSNTKAKTTKDMKLNKTRIKLRTSSSKEAKVLIPSNTKVPFETQYTKNFLQLSPFKTKTKIF